ncbi:MAG: PDZ domain-containing protein, partial [Peptococcales bacterium]
NENIVYMLVPVIAGLGYGDIALTTHPRGKTSYSAFLLAMFSIILLGLSVLAANYPSLAILAALFSPLGHELVIFLGRRREFSGKPKFVSPEEGIMVLDLLDSSPLKSAGVRIGDIILTLNGLNLKNSADLEYALQFVGYSFEIEFLSGEKKIFKRKIVKGRAAGQPLGLIIVPDNYSHSYLELASGEGFFKRFFKGLKK